MKRPDREKIDADPSLSEDVTDLITSVSGHTKGYAVLPVSAKLHEKKETVRKRKAEIEAALNGDGYAALIGEPIEGRGIYLGRYKPWNRDGLSLHKVFNVFVAPENLKDDAGKKAIFEYREAVTRVQGLKGWHGFDGAPYSNDEEILEALGKDTYDGGWIIPPGELLHGLHVTGVTGWRDNLWKHHNEGAFKNKFRAKIGQKDSDHPDYYWSSTKNPGGSPVKGVRPRDGSYKWCIEHFVRLSVRPMRLVPVPGGDA
jgi:hypothetical protein